MYTFLFGMKNVNSIFLVRPIFPDHLPTTPVVLNEGSLTIFSCLTGRKYYGQYVSVIHGDGFVHVPVTSYSENCLTMIRTH